MTYPGGKNGSGVYQAIINQIPPHDRFVEVFLGSGSISRLMRPAAASIGVDADAAAIEAFPKDARPNMELLNVDARAFLESFPGKWNNANTFMYLDPPYLFETRKSQRSIYRHEFGTAQEHYELLELLLQLNCMVAISGYWSELYGNLLKHWRVETFTGVTRSGSTATEYLWMNYCEPLELHDYRYLGQDFRQRQDIKRQTQRWVRKLAAMDATKRHALMAAIDELKTGPHRQL